MTFTLADILSARSRIKGVADKTSFRPWPLMTEVCGRESLRIFENVEPVGALKVRGSDATVMTADIADHHLTNASFDYKRRTRRRAN